MRIETEERGNVNILAVDCISDFEEDQHGVLSRIITPKGSSAAVGSTVAEINFSEAKALEMKDVWMPKEYASMKEGKIIRWFKWVGDKVSPSTSPS